MEQFAREVMSGQRRGLVASLLRAGLWGAQWPYRLIVASKNAAFNWSLCKPHKATVPVISVGNLTTGGTGKTPVVAFLANWFRDAGVKVGIVSRGYRALNSKRHDELRPLTATLSPEGRGDMISGANDEKLVLDRLCAGIPHWQNPDRIAAADEAVEAGCELLILDDAFQHRRIHRDLDIVLIDAVNPWGGGHCLPRGFLREPVAGLSRANLVMITRADAVSAAELTAIRSELALHDQVGSVAEVAFRPLGLVNKIGKTRAITEVAGSQLRCVAFCGIGNPTAFEQSLRKLNANVTEFRAFPDHHQYSTADIANLGQWADAAAADCLLTTLKDLVKLGDATIAGRPVWAVQIGTEIIRGAQILEHRLWQMRDRLR